MDGNFKGIRFPAIVSISDSQQEKQAATRRTQNSQYIIMDFASSPFQVSIGCFRLYGGSKWNRKLEDVFSLVFLALWFFPPPLCLFLKQPIIAARYGWCKGEIAEWLVLVCRSCWLQWHCLGGNRDGRSWFSGAISIWHTLQERGIFQAISGGRYAGGDPLQALWDAPEKRMAWASQISCGPAIDNPKRKM